jgi:hypothetical protein
MPSFAQTVKQAMRTQYRRGPGGLDSLELRGSNYGALSLYRKQSASPTGVLSGGLKASLESSFGRVVQAPVVDYINPTIGNTRTCAVQTGGLNSKLVVFTFFTLAFGFPLIRSEFVNNEIGEQEYLFKMLEARRLASMALLDQKCVDHLELKKNQFFPASITAYYAEANDALQVPNDERLEYYNFIQSILETMDLTGTPDVLVNPMSMADVRKIQGQGTTDEGDLSYALDGVGSFFSSNRVIPGLGNRAVQYLVGQNSVGIVSRIDPDCARGVTHGGADNPVREWTTQDVPGLGLMGLYYRQDCSDESATLAAQALQGLTRTSVESFEYSADYCLVSLYNSDEAGRHFPVIKVEQKLAA